MSHAELDALIVANLDDLMAAIAHLEVVDASVWQDLAELATDWARSKKWCIEVDPADTYKPFRLGPMSWRISDEGQAWRAYYELNTTRKDERLTDTDQPFVTYLTQSGPGTAAFFFKQKVFNKESEWKRFLRENARLVQGVPLTHEKIGTFCVPVHVSKESLAAALREEAVTDALHPLRDALEVLGRGVPALTRLLDAAEAA
jgi:hypothetical protein